MHSIKSFKVQRFRTVKELDSRTQLSQWDNSSCFIYYFTIEETFDTNDKESLKQRDNFLKETDGTPLSDIQYNLLVPVFAFCLNIKLLKFSVLIVELGLVTK